MQEGTLLERISAMEKGRQDLGPRSMGRLERSLVRHLTALLNTRQGSVPMAPDYGVPDFTDLGSSFSTESIPALREDLERIVLAYEPRLSNVRINYTPRPDMPLAAVFRLEAEVMTGEGPRRLAFETILDATGKVRLQTER